MNENKYNKSVDKLEYVCYNDIRNKEKPLEWFEYIRIENMEVPQK